MFVLDRAGTCLEANSQALALSGYTRGELLGISASAVLIPCPPKGSPASFDTIVSGQCVSLAVDVRRKDGTCFPAHVHLYPLASGMRLGVVRGAPCFPRAEMEPRDAERRARALLDVSCGLVGLVLPDGTLIEANRTALDLVGCDAADVIGKPFWETPWWVHSVEMQDRLKAAVAAGARGENVHIDATHRASDGSLHAIEFSLRPVRDERGTVVMSMVEGHDVTDMRRTEDALRTSEARYQALFESANDAITLIRGEEYVACNPATLRLFRCAARDFIGQSPVRLSPPLQPDGRDSKDKAGEMIRAALAGARASFEWRHRRLDGTEFDAEVSYNGVRIGAETFMQAIIRDVSERKRTEERLRTQELILDSIRTGVVILDSEQRTALLVNKYAAQVLGPIGASREYETLHRLLVRAEDHKGGARALDEPQTLTVQGRVLGYTVYRPSPRYYWIYVQDITEKLRLETIAESIDTMNNIGYIFSGLRHEIGNPINSIKTTLSVMRSDPARYTSEGMADLAGCMIDEIARIEYLLRSLKGFNMYESLQPEPLEINAFVRNFVVLLDAEARRKGIAVSLDLFDEPRWVLADARALQQALLNLWANAMDAIGPTDVPTVSIGLASFDYRILLRLSDNGAGMSDDVVRQLFRPFFTTKRQGTGLGLVIVKKLLSRMGSTISLTSHPGQGTTVEISLPAATPPPQGGEA